MISKSDFLKRAQLDHVTLEVWIEEDLLVPSKTGSELAFCEADLARARLIRDLIQDMGVNNEGVSVILHLLDQVHGLRMALADILERVQGRPAPPEAGTSTGQDRDDE